MFAITEKNCDSKKNGPSPARSAWSEFGGSKTSNTRQSHRMHHSVRRACCLQLPGCSQWPGVRHTALFVFQFYALLSFALGMVVHFQRWNIQIADDWLHDLCGTRIIFHAVWTGVRGCFCALNGHLPKNVHSFRSRGIHTSFWYMQKRSLMHVHSSNQ